MTLLRKTTFNERKVISYLVSIVVSVVTQVTTFSQIPKAQKVDIFENIKRIAQEEVADPNSPIIVKPVFRKGMTVASGQSLRWIDYDLGEVAVEYTGLPADDPYLLPYTMQLQIEALRSVFKTTAADMPFWNKPLLQAEQTVRDTVSDINSTKDARKREAKLLKRRKQFQADLRDLEQSLKDYASKDNYIVGYPAAHVGPVGFGPQDPFSVEIVTDPAGGRVKVVTAFVWRICLQNNCQPDRLTWRLLNAEREGMIGGYHFIAEWAGGKRDEGDITIVSDGKRTFRPAN